MKGDPSCWNELLRQPFLGAEVEKSPGEIEKLLFVGHTDAVGTDPHNLGLSDDPFKAVP